MDYDVYIVRYGVLFGRYKFVIGSNYIHFCAARFKFSISEFLIVDSMVRKYCSLMIDDKHFWCSTVHARLYITARYC